MWHSRTLRVLLLVVSGAVAALGLFLMWPRPSPEVTASPAGAGRQARHVLRARYLEQAPVKIANRVYLLGNMHPSAVYVVETSDGLAMIDTGLETAHEKLLAGLSKLGLDVRRLKLILLTHSHGDHTMGAQRLRAATGAKVHIGRGDAEPLRRGGPWEAIFSKFSMPQETLHPSIIDGELDDQQVLELGQAQFVVVATPGHTPGSCCFLLEQDGERLLFTGDTLQTFTTDVGTYVARLPPRYGGDIEQYLQSLGKLRAMPAPDLLLPGHPSADGTPDPRLDEDQWHTLIDRGIAELEQWRQRYERDGADFLDGQPKQIVEGLYYLGDFEGRAGYALVADERALLFDSVRGPDAARQLESAWQTLAVAPPAISAVALTSCQPENLTGLKSVVEATGCRVFAPTGGLERAVSFSPPGTEVFSLEELNAAGWQQVRAIPIAGTGAPHAAYAFQQTGKSVLISGSFPFDMDASECARLSRQGPPEEFSAPALSESLEPIAEVEPDVWLSALPWQGRNANLYDRNWSHTLKLNHQLLRSWR